MPIMSNFDPSQTQELHWELSHCDEGFVAIKSISNGGYLDGRDDKTSECIVSHRPPNGDQYLMWKIEESEGFVTFKCKSNNRYLDGRAFDG